MALDLLAGGDLYLVGGDSVGGDLVGGDLVGGDLVGGGLCTVGGDLQTVALDSLAAAA